METKLDKDYANVTEGVTQRYNFHESYTALSSYAGLGDIPSKLKEWGKDAKEKNSYPELKDIQSCQDLINLAIKMLGKINPELQKLANDVRNNIKINNDNHINLRPADSELSTTGSINRQGDAIVLNIDAKKDVTGVIAVAQLMVDAGIYYKNMQNENKQHDIRKEFAKKAATTFVGYAMVDAMAKEPYMNITPEQKSQLTNSLLRQDFNIESLEADVKIFEDFSKSHPNLDIENMDKDTLNEYFEQYRNNNFDPEFQEAVQKRMKDVAEENKTPRYLTNEAMKTIVALQTIDNVQEHPDADPVKKLILGATGGLTVQEMTGKTPPELAKDAPELINKMERGEMSALPENMMEDENDREMVMQRERFIRQQVNNNM